MTREEEEFYTEIAKIHERHEYEMKEWGRNWKQHEEFYSKLNILESEIDRIKGGLKVISIVLIPILISVVVSLIRSFIAG